MKLFTLKNLLFVASLIILTLFIHAPAQNLYQTWESNNLEVDGQKRPIKFWFSNEHQYVEYPSVPCGGEWILVKKNRTQIWFKENITYGLDKCKSGGNIFIEQLNSYEMQFSYSPPDSKTVTGSTVLTRGKKEARNQPNETIPLETEIASSKSKSKKKSSKTAEVPSIEDNPEENKRRDIGAKIEETIDFALYERYKECNSPTFYLVLKTYDDDYVISPDNPKYKALIENNILPIVKSRCPNIKVDYIGIFNYFQGIHLYKTSEEGFKVYKTGDNFPGNHEDNILISIRHPYDQITYSYSWPFNDYVSLNRLPNINKFLIDQNQQKKKDEIARLEQQKRDEEKRLADIREEERKQQEAERKRRIEELPQRIARERVAASDILELYKKGAPQNIDFSQYMTTVKDIYIGNFKPFTGDYEIEDMQKSEANFEKTSVGALLGQKSLDDLAPLKAEALKFAKLRIPIRVAYFAYHQAFEKQCYPNDKELPWITKTRRIDTVTTRGGLVIDRIEGATYVYTVREVFMKAFDETYNTATGYYLLYAAIGEGNLNLQQNLQNDFTKFLKSYGCSSPATRQLEINLYLGVEWMNPLQVLQPPVAEENKQTISPAKVTNSGQQVQKPKPIVKKATVRTGQKP